MQVGLLEGLCRSNLSLYGCWLSLYLIMCVCQVGSGGRLFVCLLIFLKRSLMLLVMYMVLKVCLDFGFFLASFFLLDIDTADWI